MEVRLPDEHHYKSNRFDCTTSSEAALDRVLKRLMKKQNHEARDDDDDDTNVDDEDAPAGPEPFSNSRMSFGKRNKPKRQFIMPSLRQAAPANSNYIHPVSECHWKCKLCGMDILAAVISAGAIRHFRTCHPLQLEKVQSELCKARLERISDGCMEFVNPEEIECLICGMTYPLHRPYNMCRAIRHLKLKHPEQMPEYHLNNYSEAAQEVVQETVEEDGIEESLVADTLPINRRHRKEEQVVEEEEIDQLLEEPQPSTA